jgi:DNA-binding transcriptional LysR family regulator
MLDLEQLKTFRVVAMTESFTRAAAELGCCQSSVTTRIKLLERELGALLFERFRFSRKVILTEVGRRTFDYAEQLLALADKTKVAAQIQATDPSGELRVGAPEALLTYRLSGVLHRFQTLYPKVQLGVSSNNSSEMLVIGVAEGVTDVAFVIDQPVRSDKVLVEPLAKEELVFVAAPDHNFTAAGGYLDARDLARIPMLFSEHNCPFRVILNRSLRVVGIRLDGALEVGSIEAVKQCVMAGMGIAVLPLIAVTSELDRRALVRVPCPAIQLLPYTQMIRPKARWTLPALTALWDLATQAFDSVLTH